VIIISSLDAPKSIRETLKNPKNPLVWAKTQKNPLGWVLKKTGFFPTLIKGKCGTFEFFLPVAGVCCLGSLVVQNKNCSTI
jgi:hypothetical protein